MVDDAMTIPARPDMPALVARAHAGDASAVAELRRIHASAPETFMGYCPDLVTFALQLMRKRIASGPGMALIGEAMEDRLQAMRVGLEGPNPTPIEAMMAGRCVMCWLDAFSLDILAETTADQTPTQVERWDRRRDRAHSRFLKAMKTLAHVRRVKLPALLQVNMPGAQVVNMAGNKSGGPSNQPSQLTSPKEIHP